jgi:hypothetical protein
MDFRIADTFTDSLARLADDDDSGRPCGCTLLSFSDPDLAGFI